MITIPINLNNVQSQRIVVSANTNAANDSNYVAVANATFTDPTPAEGKGFTVYVRNGTSTIGGTAYVAGSVVYRFFHSGSWINKIVSTGAFNLPNVDGTANQVLQTNGAGTVTWQTVGGGNITIGTTAIASGTVNRILFQGAGDVVQQDSTFVWNNTDKRLILGTEAVADTNSRLVVIGKGTGTNTTFAVHNSTGTNNALVVRDDGFIGFGTETPNLSNIFRIVNSSLNYLDISADGGVQIGRNAAISTNATNSNVSIAIGRNTIARATTTGSVAIGDTALAGVGNVAIGTSATAGISSGFSASAGAIAIGLSAVANTSGGGGGIAIGRSATASTNGTDNITLAQDSSITSNSNVANIMIGRFLRVSTNSRSYAYAIGSGVSSASRATLGIDNSFSLYFNNNERSFFVNSLSNIVLRSQQSLIAGTQYDANATNTLTLHNGTAPATNLADAFQEYSADIVAGNAAPHFRTENGSIIKIYQETTAIAAAAFVANTSLIANDTATFGGYTIGQVVAALKAQGLLA